MPVTTAPATYFDFDCGCSIAVAVRGVCIVTVCGCSGGEGVLAEEGPFASAAEARRRLPAVRRRFRVHAPIVGSR